MKTQHTPGPWKFKIGRFPKGAAFGFKIHNDAADPDKTHSLASAGIYEESGVTAFYLPEEIEANAHLIAAAPDLAAALVAVSRSLDLQRARMQEEFDCIRSADKKAILTPRLEAMARALETAKAALAKLSS